MAGKTMIYTVDLGDGRVMDIEGPEGATAEQLQAVVAGQGGGGEDAPAAGSVDPSADLQQLFDSGATQADLEAAYKAQNGDPSTLKGLADAIAYRDQGGKGAKFQPSGVETPRTAGDRFQMGVADVAQGVGDVLGLVANPLNAGLNLTGLPQAITGGELGTDLGQTFRNAVGGPEAMTEGEQFASAINRGGAGALAFSGGAAALARGSKVAAEVAANPVRDFISGLTGGAGAEAGERIGGVPGAIVGGLAGGAAGAIGTMSAIRRAEALASKFPRSAIVDDAGNLTEDGLEIAQRVGADPSEVVTSYARARTVGGPRPRVGASERRAAVSAAITPEQRAAVARVAGAGGEDTATAPARSLDEQTRAIQSAIAARLPQDPPPLSPFDEAAGEGVQLTRGQAEQDFNVQNDENGLRVAASREGERARQFFEQQRQQITDAAERFRASFGEDPGNAADRGARVQQAVSDLRDAGAEGVRTLYREAEALGGQGLRLNVEGIRDAATDILIDEAVPETVKRAVSQELARYGIVGAAEPTNEVGITRVALDDGSAVSFRGPVKELTASNAEDLRRAINRLYDPMKPNHSGQTLKPAIDDALEEAVAGAQGEGQIGNAYRVARQAHQTQKRTFAAKDIIDNLVSNKKGTQTPVLLPERAIAQVIGQGKEGLSNLRKVRGLLLSSQTPSSRQAWAAIQQQALADIFESAVQRNTNVGGGLAETISGAKLRTQIFEKFGADKLRLILGDEEFGRLMRLQRIIGNATIPMSGTTNPSGTFTKLVNFLGRGALKFTGGFGDAAASLAGKARDLATTRKTLRGITSYDGNRQTGERMDQQAREFIREYIASGSAGRFVPTEINLAATQGTDK